MGQCNLCRFSSEEKEKEQNQTLLTDLEQSPETRTKKVIIKEIDLNQRINTIGSDISQKNTLNNSFSYILPESISKHENIKNNYQITSTLLGRGGSSNIFLSTKGEEKFAIKQIIKGGVAKPEELLREANISLYLDHNYIIKYYEIYEDYSFIYFVMELGESGDLFEFITFSEEGCLSSEIAIDILIQIFEAVDYLHYTKQIIHRDIKAENFVLKIDEYNNITIKLIDFGLAIEKPPNDEKLYEIIGTRKYQSPEMICGYGYGEKVDEWAIGVVMFSMLTGYEPFRRTGQFKLEESILYDGINFEIIPDADLRMLNERLLDRNEISRITCKEALNYLKNLKIVREPLYNDELYLYQRNLFIDSYKKMLSQKFSNYQRTTL